MIKTITVAKAIAVYLAFTVHTAFAAPINLQQAYDKLLAADTTGQECTLGVSGKGCPIPEGGVTIDTIDGFITLSSPGSAAFLTDIAQGTFIVYSATTVPVIAEFSFEDLQVPVSNIIFNAAPPESFTCTVDEAPTNCSGDSNPFMLTGYDSIMQLNLSSLEGFANTFAYNVPVPPAFLLFLSGLAGLVGVAGKKRRT